MRNFLSLMLALFLISTRTMSSKAQEGGLLLLPNDLTSKAIIRSMDISNDGKYVVAAAFDGDGENSSITTLLWKLDEVSSDRRLLPAFARTDIIPFFAFYADVAFSPDSQYFVTHEENSLLLYETSGLSLKDSFAINNNSFRKIIWSSDSKLVGSLYSDSMTKDRKFTVWDVSNNDKDEVVFEDFSPQFVDRLNERWLFHNFEGNLKWCDLTLQLCDQRLSDGNQGDIVVGNSFFLQPTYLSDNQGELVFWEDTPEGFAPVERYLSDIVENDHIQSVSNNRQFATTSFVYLWDIHSNYQIIRMNMSSDLFTSDSHFTINFDSRRLFGYDTSNGAEAFSVDLQNYLGMDTTGFFFEDTRLYKLSADDAFALVSFYNFAALVPIPGR